jgi:hypothetical protein
MGSPVSEDEIPDVRVGRRSQRKLTLRLDDVLRRRLEAEAKDQERTLQAQITFAIRRCLESKASS